MSKFDEIQKQLITAEAEQKTARENADIDKRQELENTMEHIASQRQRITQDISFAISHLAIVQRIYFMAGLDKPATDLAERVDSITRARISLPPTRTENKNQFDHFQLYSD